MSRPIGSQPTARPSSTTTASAKSKPLRVAVTVARTAVLPSLRSSRALSKPASKSPQRSALTLEAWRSTQQISATLTKLT